MFRAAGLVSLVILGCSGAPPARHGGGGDWPIGGLPPRFEAPPVGEAEPGASRALRPARPERFAVRRIAPAPEHDSMSGGPRSLSHRVDLELAHAPVAEAFRFLADAANVNVVLGDGVDGEITLRLRRVTVRDALRAVAATRDLRTEWRGNILWVSPAAAR